MSKRDIAKTIVDAALELSSRNNLHQISQAKIAKHAGVSQSHLTYYFPKRSELIKAALDRMSNELFADMLVVTPDTTAAKVQQLFKQRCLADVREQSRAWLMISAMEASQEDESLKLWFSEFEKSLYEHFENSLQQIRLQATKAESSILFMSIVGLSILNIHLIDNDRLEMYAENLGVLIDHLIERSQA